MNLKHSQGWALFSIFKKYSFRHGFSTGGNLIWNFPVFPGLMATIVSLTIILIGSEEYKEKSQICEVLFW